MSPGTITLITYLWHYLIARLLFDQLLRPLERGDESQLLLLLGICAVGFLLGRLTARREPWRRRR